MTNSSAPGYLLPALPPTPLQGNLTLDQFIQTILVGISNLPGDLVRPKWQVNPPKNPDIFVNWIAYGIESVTPDANAFVGINPDESNNTIRHEKIEVKCAFYGPAALDLSAQVRDGFQIQQNLANLVAAKMGYTEVGPALHIPDLLNERFVNRVEISIYLQRMQQRTYPILTFVSVNGTITTENQGDQNTTIDFKT